MLKIHVTATGKLYEDCQNDPKQFGAVQEAINCFMQQDWGNIGEEDKRANDKDYAERTGHVLARYNTLYGDIFISLLFVEGMEHKAVMMYCDEY